SKIGLGCGVFSGAYGPISHKDIVGVIRTAFSNGVNMVDTSPYYNDSEIKLGKALLELKAEFPRSSYCISTKLGRYGYHKSDFDYSAERVVSSVKESMRRLHTEYLDSVLCHDVEFVDMAQIIDVTLPKLFELKQNGIVRQVGISGYPLDVLLRIAQMQYERGYPIDICLSYCNFNLHCQRLPEYVPLLRAAGVKTIIAASPLSMGLLQQDTPPDWHPANSELKKAVLKCKALIRLFISSSNSTHDISLEKIAESFAFSLNSVDLHLVGAKSSAEMTCALEVYKQAQQLQLASGGTYPDNDTQKIYEQIRQILQPFKDYTWPSP
ncbi:Aldo/keto reductase, partial [Coemansia reversa NRRL 1564]